MTTTFEINGRKVTIKAPDDSPLLWAIRDEVGLTGSKFGCGIGACGACTVHLNGEAVRSCVTPVNAAAGAKVGALVDLGTGGMTLGAGTALGATLGGATAWLLGRLRRQGAANGLLQHMTEAACIHYLVIAHQSRVSDAESPGLAGRWDAEVTGTVAAHWDALAAALQTPGAPPAALQSLLDGMLRGILQRSISPGPATPQ